jgi:hypothetical protein
MVNKWLFVWSVVVMPSADTAARNTSAKSVMVVVSADTNTLNEAAKSAKS